MSQPNRKRRNCDVSGPHPQMQVSGRHPHMQVSGRLPRMQLSIPVPRMQASVRHHHRQVSGRLPRMKLSVPHPRMQVSGPRTTFKNKKELDTPVIPSTSKNPTKGLKRKREENPIDSKALQILKKIPNLINRERATTSWLHFARPVREPEEIHKLILKYINNTQVHRYGIKVLDILEIRRVDDIAYESKPEWMRKNRMLLWHGTSEENLASILINGFKIPVLKRQMFGAGIYFADRASKSANYCSRNRPKKERRRPGTKGILLLCDVLVGNFHLEIEAKQTIIAPPRNYDSILGNGLNIPNRKEQVDFKGSCIPLGETVVNKVGRFLDSCPISYNEYVIYKPENVKPVYLVKFKYVKKPVRYG